MDWSKIGKALIRHAAMMQCVDECTDFAGVLNLLQNSLYTCGPGPGGLLLRTVSQVEL